MFLQVRFQGDLKLFLIIFLSVFVVVVIVHVVFPLFGSSKDLIRDSKTL